MGFNWREFLALAEDLSQRNDEASRRTAVSRSYYYVYHLARKRLEDNSFPFVRNESMHRQVWEKFERDPDPRCKKLYQLANILRDKRNQADYEQTFPRIESEVAAILKQARQFESALIALEPRLPANNRFRP